MKTLKTIYGISGKVLSTIAGLTLLALVASCSSDSSADGDDRMVSMPIVLAIPASNASLTAEGTHTKTTRAEGDPGTYEKFELPKYLYIYLINTSINGSETVLTPEGMGKDGYSLDSKKWTKTTTQDNNKDSIYTYTDQIRIIIPENRSKGVVYAAMSTVPITVTYTGNDVADATFTLGSDAKDNESEALKNLYSSPYNLTKDNQYYGIVSDYNSNSPYINMVLYHVASKLDLQWNVDASVQDKVKLGQIKLTGLSGGGKLFKPLENTTATSTYDETFSLDDGSQWYGRQATYVIPVKSTDGNYQFPMTLTNGAKTPSTTTKATATVKKPSNANTVYVPWMLGTVTVKKTW